MTITKGSPTPAPSPTASGGTSSAEDQGAQKFRSDLQAGGATGAGRVFMGFSDRGSTNPALSEAAQARKQVNPRTPSWWSIDGAENQYFDWTQKARDDFRARGLLSGLLTHGAGDLEAFSLWKSLVSQAALYGARDRQVSPFDILSGYVKGTAAGGWVRQGDFEVNPTTGEKRYVGPRTKTTTQRQVDLTDPATARAVAIKVFQDMLGRDPNQGEIAAYASALSQSEAQNPSVATTTTQYDMATGDAVGSSTVTSGGMTADAQAQLAADKIKGTDEYGVTQAATTYMDALTRAVGGNG